jgi:hypothetical protein
MIGGGVGAAIFGLYALTNSVNHQRHLERTNCTILDIRTVSAGAHPYWVIDVEYIAPSSFHRPPNTTYSSSLDTHTNANYYVNQTLPCFVFAQDLGLVSFSHSAVNGTDVFGIIVLSILLNIPILIGVYYMLRFAMRGLIHAICAVYGAGRSSAVQGTVILRDKMFGIPVRGATATDPELFDLGSRNAEDTPRHDI